MSQLRKSSRVVSARMRLLSSRSRRFSNVVSKRGGAWVGTATRPDGLVAARPPQGALRCGSAPARSRDRWTVRICWRPRPASSSSGSFVVDCMDYREAKDAELQLGLSGVVRTFEGRGPRRTHGARRGSRTHAGDFAQRAVPQAPAVRPAPDVVISPRRARAWPGDCGARHAPSPIRQSGTR